MEEEHSTNNNSNEIISSNSRRLQIRRGILRQTTTLRSLPYNSSLSSLRRRQTSQTISNLINNIENNNQSNVNTSLNNQEEIEIFLPETEIISNNFLVTSDDDNDHEDFEVLVDFSNTSPVDLTISNENTNSNHEQNQSYHSLSTIDFDPDDDDDDHHFYYTSTSIPVFDYSSSTEPIIVHNNSIDMTQYQYDDEYSSSINNPENDDEDLSIEIILETSQNNSLSSTSRRRHSIIPSNIRNNRGLRLSDILSIPQKIYSSLKEQINDKYQQTIIINTQCYICLEDFQSIDSIKILNCQHIFHAGCINEWLRGHSNCAYCRTPILIDILRSSTTTTTGRRQRTRARRNIRSSANNSSQQISIESSTFEQQQQQP